MKISIITITATLLFFATLAFAQAKRGTLVHEETIRVAPNADAARLGEAGRGHELVIIETSRALGMQTLDSSIKQLYVNGYISREDAISQAAGRNMLPSSSHC